jgi:vacuolar-type H+-ATPase subunit H
MGKRADRAKAKAEELADDTVSTLRSGAHSVVDGAEELMGKTKRKTRKTRKHVDEIADKAEKRIAKMRRQTERRAKRIRRKAQAQIDKATRKLPTS